MAQLVCVRDGALDHEDYWKILVRSSIWVFIPYWTHFSHGDCSEHEWEGDVKFRIVSRHMAVNHACHYVHWHIIQISVANLTVIILMVVTFIVALFAPFPGRRRRKEKP